MGWGFCRYDITTAEMDSMKPLIICFVSSELWESAKLRKEQ